MRAKKGLMSRFRKCFERNKSSFGGENVGFQIIHWVHQIQKDLDVSRTLAAIDFGQIRFGQAHCLVVIQSTSLSNLFVDQL